MWFPPAGLPLTGFPPAGLPLTGFSNDVVLTDVVLTAVILTDRASAETKRVAEVHRGEFWR